MIKEEYSRGKKGERRYSEHSALHSRPKDIGMGGIFGGKQLPSNRDRTRGRLAGPEGFEPSISGFQRRNHRTTAPQASVLIQPRLRAHKNNSRHSHKRVFNAQSLV